MIEMIFGICLWKKLRTEWNSYFHQSNAETSCNLITCSVCFGRMREALVLAKTEGYQLICMQLTLLVVKAATPLEATE